jgi:hypothetical protein
MCKDKICFNVTTKVNYKLEKKFPTQDVMDALGLVYPQDWLNM